MKKRDRSGDGGGNWMDTYGDLVTLLLTFFVMLYSMSNLNEQKWQVFVRSIYQGSLDDVSEQVVVNGAAGDMDGMIEGSSDIPELTGSMNEDMDIGKLYLVIASQMNEIGIDGVTVSRGDEYSFIIFEDKTFFDGDSSVLTRQGKMTLDVFCSAIAPARDQLSQINIMAHTAQGDPEHPNNPRTDRMLSAMRAAEVCTYIQGKDIIQPEKLINISYGQFRPIDTNDTREGRARNRRVEILLIDENADVHSLNKYYDEYRLGVNADTTIITDGNLSGEDSAFKPAEADSDTMSSAMSPLSSGADTEAGFTAEAILDESPAETVAE